METAKEKDPISFCVVLLESAKLIRLENLHEFTASVRFIWLIFSFKCCEAAFRFTSRGALRPTQV